MDPAITIKPVSSRNRTAAIRFVVAGASRDPIHQVATEALRHMVMGCGWQNIRLWWANRQGRCLAAGMIIENVGKVGMLFHTPISAEGVEIRSLIELVHNMSSHALDEGLSMVQAHLEPPATGEIEMLTAGGFEKLTRIVYMNLDLKKVCLPEHDAEISWRKYDEFTETELADVILRTYEGTLDCPSMNDLREIADIISGHKRHGIFSPESWWLIDRGGHPCGCILVNDSHTTRVAEIVYLGVVPEYRGFAIGQLLLRYAAAQAYRRGRKAVTLATDAENHYARRIYEVAGFREKASRLSYIMRRRILTRDRT